MSLGGNSKHLTKLKDGISAWNKWRLDHPDFVPDLNGADMSQLDLRQADLRGANLSGAILRTSHLSAADLRGADLSDADLSNTNLVNTNLSGALLAGAWLRFTGFSDVNLSETNGLDKCIHHGPSIIDYSTLEKSGELIPLVFWQGCGLPDWLIESVEANIHGAIRFYSCFISYSNKDESFAKRLHADLQSKGVRCWFAPEDLKIGDKVRDVIEGAIRLHDKLILILSETSIESDWVEHEVSQALEREEKDSSPVLFPIRMDDAVMDAKFGWAKAIREAHKPTGRHIGDFTNWKEHDSYQGALDRLMRDLRANE